MKRNGLFVILVFLGLILVFPISHATAAKSMAVIEMSNGFPSGPHYNLNILGKSATFTCDPTMGGNSVFISEYGNSTITYVTNNKSPVSELIALDKCAEAFDTDPAKVQLPYESQGYYVFAAIKGKPNNSTTSEGSSIILSPNVVREACNAINPDDPDFANLTQCDTLLTLGLVVGYNVYEATDVGFVRFDTQETGKGKSMGKDITDLFKWTGYVFSATLDLNGDGEITYADVPSIYDLDADGIEYSEYLTWANEQVSSDLATYYENEWILNIADLVLTDQPISNDGTKLLQVRFYPVATTVYIPPAQ